MISYDLYSFIINSYDYALTETSPYFSLNCLVSEWYSVRNFIDVSQCGKALCRKNVTGDDWKVSSYYNTSSSFWLDAVTRAPSPLWQSFPSVHSHYDRATQEAVEVTSSTQHVLTSAW